MSDYTELVQRLRDSQHNNIIAGWEGDARDDREAADAITKLRAERDDFYSDYRMKCNKETKALTVERNALVTELIAVEDERDVFAALLREAQDWLNTDVCLDAEGVSLYNRIDAALAKENNNG